MWAEGKPVGYLAQGAGQAHSQPEQRRGQQEVQAGCCGTPSASSAVAAASTASLAWWQPGKQRVSWQRPCAHTGGLGVGGEKARASLATLSFLRKRKPNETLPLWVGAHL